MMMLYVVSGKYSSFGDRNSSGSRTYQLVLRHMKFLPYHSYIKEALLNLWDCTTNYGKRKADVPHADSRSQRKLLFLSLTRLVWRLTISI